MNVRANDASMAAANRAAPVLTWILEDGLRCKGIDSFVGKLAEKLVAAGIPIDRMVVSVRVLTATVIARSYGWRPETGPSITTFDWAERDLGLYERSPFKIVHETGEWVDLKLAETPNEAFGIVPDMRAEGFTHYIAMPVQFGSGTTNIMAIATRDPDGFDAGMLEVIRILLPALTAAVELRALDEIMHEVLAIYVGAEPAKHILSGTVHRGEVHRISSAIMFVDMRDFTRRTQNMTADETAELLNRYYDCVVPHVEANGGSVLKFIGDGILAIFPDGDDGASASTQAALKAARETLAAVPAACPKGKASFEIGIALHHGVAAYGNVGSGERLDFTVVGRDVNLTDRVGRLNKKLGIPLLLSDAFRSVLDQPVESCGRHTVASFDDVIEVFQPV